MTYHAVVSLLCKLVKNRVANVLEMPSISRLKDESRTMAPIIAFVKPCLPARVSRKQESVRL